MTEPIPSPNASPASPAERPLIEVQDLHKSYGATRALSGVSFNVKPGEIRGFLGPNGAGKSTTIRIITGYLAADQGSARVAGFDVATETLEARERIGYLPEMIPLYGEMRVDEYLKFIGQSRGLSGTRLKERTEFVVERLGLGRMLKRLTSSLSKGYRQRVGLAQAMIHDPKVLILDEPTNGLDPQQIIEVRSLIQELSRDKAILFSTHILQEISAICSQIMIVRDGVLVAEGTPAELARDILDQELWEVVVRGDRMDSSTLGSMGLSGATYLEETPRGHVYRFQSAGEPEISALNRSVADAGNQLVEVRAASRTLEQVYMKVMGVDEKGAA